MILVCVSAVVCDSARAEAELLVGSHPDALRFPHFPDGVHAFVFRNWGLVEAGRLSKVLGTSAENVERVAESMGLPPAGEVSGEMLQRGYITLIRRNWHLLPYHQLLTLLGWDAEHLAFTLKEDDFLWIKLGSLKPKCEPLRYAPPSAEASARAAKIRRIVTEGLGDALAKPPEARFAFIRDLAAPLKAGEGAPAGASVGGEKDRFSPRFLYSYFALYGDALSEPELDPYPEGYLQRLAALGVNGVWLQGVLHQLAPSPGFPEFGKGHERRLESLRQLVKRAGKHGVGVYLYFNEPRAMPPAFFEKRPEMKGVAHGPFARMCTSSPAVRAFIKESLTHVFREVPGLAGAFTITASENPTNCWSHHQGDKCPRCGKRSGAEVVAEVLRTIGEGVRAANPKAAVIAWDWGWRDDWVEAIIEKLPPYVSLQSVSEWSLPIERGGVKGAVGEYSISAVGPGPRATKHWALAKKHGLRTMAKLQINNTWELSSVPFIPALSLVAKHCRRLADSGVDGIQLSWTLGGYPSPNLAVIRQYYGQEIPTEAEALRRVATERYGGGAAAAAVRAWQGFGTAFAEYPYDGSVVYNSPAQMGPANLLYGTPTGYRATMVGIPYDDLPRWRGRYPADIFAGQHEKIAAGWGEAMPHIEEAASLANASARATAQADVRVAEACLLHFKSVANQTRFMMLRKKALAKPPPDDAKKMRAALGKIIEDEIGLARRMFAVARADSRIGYEASNHYFYLPRDLLEKVVNCRYLLDTWLPATLPER